MNDKVAIFIDGSNIFHGCREYDPNFKIDYVKLVDVLLNGRKLLRPYYYGSFDPSNPDQANRQKRFHQALQEKGFHVTIKPLRRRDDNKIEKGVDVALVTDMLSLGFKNAYDVAILVSGDNDFVHAVEELKAHGKIVEVAMFENAIGGELKRMADKFISLNKIADRIRK
ncbi:NYN domain-containing protein [Archaeoglobales archaeon]|nr:MAG: NYN domain-containing protein [Archaeoglobales archaeon]